MFAYLKLPCLVCYAIVPFVCLFVVFGFLKRMLKVRKHRLLGLIVQSVVSLMSSLRVISLTVLAVSIYNILILFTEKECE